MFNRYSELIQKLFNHIVAPESIEISFMDYLTVLWQTLLIILVTVLVVGVFSGVILGPWKAYKKLTFELKKNIAEMSGISAHDDTFDGKKLAEYKNKLRKRNIAYGVFIVLLYIPFMIPTVLFVMTLIANFFA